MSTELREDLWHHLVVLAPQCCGKARLSSDVARKAARATSGTGTPMEAYCCALCRAWHLGRHVQPKNLRKQGRQSAVSIAWLRAHLAPGGVECLVALWVADPGMDSVVGELERYLIVT